MPTTKPKKLTPQQKRDRRAKLLLAVLGILLLVVLAVEVPGMLGGKKTPVAASTTTSATTTTTGGSTTAGAPAAAAAAATPASYQVVARAQPGQLTRFSRLRAKDPFHALVTVPNGGGGSGSSPGSSPSSTTPAKVASPASVKFSATPTSTTPAGPMVLAAVLKLDGKRHVIAVGDSFPLVNPLFKLVAVGKGSIWITLVGGSFASGDTTLKIQLKHPVKLDNTTAGVSYLISLVRVTTVHQPFQSVTTTTGSTTTTSTTSATTTAAVTTGP
jgi:hypothetical protein